MPRHDLYATHVNAYLLMCANRWAGSVPMAKLP